MNDFKVYHQQLIYPVTVENIAFTYLLDCATHNPPATSTMYWNTRSPKYNRHVYCSVCRGKIMNFKTAKGDVKPKSFLNLLGRSLKSCHMSTLFK